MTQPNHTELQRDMGRMEATLEALEKAVTQGFEDIKSDMRVMRADIAELKLAEGKRGAVERFAAVIGGVVGSIITLAVSVIAGHFWK